MFQINFPQDTLIQVEVYGNLYTDAQMPLVFLHLSLRNMTNSTWLLNKHLWITFLPLNTFLPRPLKSKMKC
jgi:hypothetical protein